MPGHSGAPASRRTKIFALAAGGALIVGGLGYTLASWTDTEWVFGGNGAGAPGVGTSTFEVEQNVTAPFADSGFSQHETNPGQQVTFSVNALALTPGDTTYAPVALRTTAGSVAGSLQLEPAVRATGVTTVDDDNALWGALHVRVATSTNTAAACNAATFTTSPIIADGSLATTGGTGTQTLAANKGSTQVYCFELSLPANPVLPNGVTLADLQGRTAAPAWQFAAQSN